MVARDLRTVRERVHPWMRAPQIAEMLAFLLGAVGVIIASYSQMKVSCTRTVFILLGSFASVIFAILFVAFSCLAIRDYIELFPEFTRHLFGIKWLKY